MNTRRSGRHAKSRSNNAVTPGTGGVQCQRFSPRCAGSRLFEAGRGKPVLAMMKVPKIRIRQPFYGCSHRRRKKRNGSPSRNAR